MNYHKISYESFFENIEYILNNSNNGKIFYDDMGIPDKNFILTVENNDIVVIFNEQVDLKETNAYSITMKDVTYGEGVSRQKIFKINSKFVTDKDFIVNMLYYIYSKVYAGELYKDIFLNINKFFNIRTDELKKVYGLIGELVFISTFEDKNSIVSIWHKNASDTFDFTSEKEKFEIKTTLKAKRVHNLSGDQIEKSNNVTLVSVQLLLVESGTSLKNLIEDIKNELNSQNKLKFDQVVEKTLGKDNNITEEFNFDLYEAKKSIMYFTIPKNKIFLEYTYVESYSLLIDFTKENTKYL